MAVSERFDTSVGPEYPRGFRAGGLNCGLKASGKPDLAMIWAEGGLRVFGAFTRNCVFAAPVQVCRERLEWGGKFRGVVANSGNANACTGEQGLCDAREMATLAERATGSEEGSFLVCSTGVIGHPLDMSLLRAGIPKLGAALVAGEKTEVPFQRAIMTTDTRPKNFGLELEFAGGRARIAGCCKGAGMIHPDRATLLAFVTTDLELPQSFEPEFKAIVDDSFNSITVDGDTSTNDTALLFSGSGSGLSYEQLGLEEQGRFREALFSLFAELAKGIVRDGEGATKFVEFQVRQAESRAQARRLGRFVANSKLVKTAIFGNDPNWGRILSSLGSAGEKIDPAKTVIRFDDVVIFASGEPTHPPMEELRKIVGRKEFAIRIELGLGSAQADVWTCDLSYEYVKINAEYTT